MAASTFAATGAPGSPITFTDYRPGVCNIGPAEIARRRRAGYVGSLATVVALVVLVAIGAPPIARVLIAIPAAVAASGFLQAQLRFCAGFASIGVFNFGPLGTTEQVVDAEARALDRRRARQISVASAAIGVAVGVLAVLLPV